MALPTGCPWTTRRKMPNPQTQCPDWNDQDEHKAPACFQNAAGVIDTACNRVKQAPPTLQDLEAWHGFLFKDTVPLPYYAGHCRQVNPAFPCLNTPVYVGNVPGARASDAMLLTDRLCDQIRAALVALESGWQTLGPEDKAKRLAVIVGSAIGAFIKIHPFRNGNGRTSRLLWLLLLHRLGFPAQASVWKRPSEPYGQMMACAMRGDFSPAIAMVLFGLDPAGVVGLMPKPTTHQTP